MWYQTNITYTTKPTYVINATYHYDTDYNSGTSMLSIRHQGNRDIALSYEDWSDAYVHGLTLGYIHDIVFTAGEIIVHLDGSAGPGAFYLNCSTYGQPTTQVGFDWAKYYDTSHMYVANYGLNSPRGFRISFNGMVGGAGSSPTLPSDAYNVQAIYREIVVYPGQEKIFNITYIWDEYLPFVVSNPSPIIIENIQFRSLSAIEYNILDTTPILLDDPESGCIFARIKVPIFAVPRKEIVPVESTVLLAGVGTIPVNFDIPIIVRLTPDQLRIKLAREQLLALLFVGVIGLGVVVWKVMK
jgi:hypothetical protein